MSDVRTDPTSGESDLQSALHADQGEFPFKVELSIEPLVRFWTDNAGEDCPAKTAMAALVRKALDAAPELSGTIADLQMLAPHEGVLDVLMSAVFPPAFWDQEYSAALIPFQLQTFYATPAFERLFVGADGRVQGRVNLDEPMIAKIRRMFAYALVGRRIYGVDIDIDFTLIFTASDPDTGLDRHFKMEFDWRFVDVVPIGPVPELSEDVRARLRAHLDLERVPEFIQADRFVLRGLTILRTIEVTDQEVLSSLKRDLIDKESIVSATRFLGLQTKLRTLFRRPELRLGLAAVEGDQVLVLNDGARLEHSCIFADSAHHKTAEFAGSIYARAVNAGRPLIVHDLAAEPTRTEVDEQIVCGGIRNIIVAPLYYQDRLIGTLELGSPTPGDMNVTHMPKIREILPLFSMAVQRSMEELNNRIQAFIKEKCTAIHPVVEWRFRKAALASMERRVTADGSNAPDMEEIVFSKVRPLYALSDIRGSSTHRARSIQADLLTQLRMARQVVVAAHRTRPLPALDELRYRIDTQVERIDASLQSGDELGVIAFLRRNVESLFEHLQEFGPDVRAAIETYRSAIDPRVGTVYDQRRRFEDSVTRLTETISAYLDLEEQSAQTLTPHYFEKQKTDGVDYQIYVGSSLVEDGRSDPLSLKNLRLWQLMVTCGVALRSAQLRDGLPMPLETAHLILVQHAPLSIRFRFDEKRFDVDGAYDVRYEIVKKRIDKAVIKGSGERITQPGKIAIVYSQSDEVAEYRAYIEYLQSLGYLTAEVEDVELEELQGVHGLRALRVTVDLRNPRLGKPVPLSEFSPASLN